MKVDFLNLGGGATLRVRPAARVLGETERLREVVLCPPAHLEAVPCCSVTRESLRDGFVASVPSALAQHAALQGMLEARGVSCHVVPASPDLPDMCFTRDVAVTTPWGLTILNPAAPHRTQEADALARAAARWTGQHADRVSTGTIEGGDVCIARPGLLIVGVSGERTSEAGADAFAARFRAEGWDVLLCRFDPHFLHLDTIFCLVSPTLALACTDVLDEGFLAAVAACGIDLLPVSYKESRRLGCNVVSLDGHTVLAAAATPRVSAAMRGRGFEVIELDVSQFAACGGGLHCLTMPLRRG